MCAAKGKRQRTAAVQNLAAVRLGLENAKRLGLRQSSAAFARNLVADTLNCTSAEELNRAALLSLQRFSPSALAGLATTSNSTQRVRGFLPLLSRHGKSAS